MTSTTPPVAGFIGPPEWEDPSPIEFQTLTGVRSLGHMLELAGFDWSLDRIGTCESELGRAAVALVDRGATIIGIVGNPFGWAGLDTGERPHDRNRRITSVCGVPVVSAVSGILDWLGELGAERVALAATYYDDLWCTRWADFVTGVGFTVTRVASMADLHIIDDRLEAADLTHWTPTPVQVEANICGVLQDAPADAVVVSGAGARTLRSGRRLAEVAGVPVVAADTALYQALCFRAALELPTALIAQRDAARSSDPEIQRAGSAVAWGLIRSQCAPRRDSP